LKVILWLWSRPMPETSVISAELRLCYGKGTKSDKIEKEEIRVEKKLGEILV